MSHNHGSGSSHGHHHHHSHHHGKKGQEETKDATVDNENTSSRLLEIQKYNSASSQKLSLSRKEQLKSHRKTDSLESLAELKHQHKQLKDSPGKGHHPSVMVLSD